MAINPRLQQVTQRPGERTHEGQETLNTTFRPFVPARLGRKCLVLGVPNGAVIFFSFGDDSTLSPGILSPSTAQPLTLTREIHGNIVERKIYARINAGTQVVSYWESME